ncbi:hypothetical protein HDA32_004714 [Spinactinospora alkalitolerans]|uniref:Uncharacterized protein n=1 Tax=Spinactinospora alkalitolerans TaxID=687207 RepID=A0A852U695_9ACTN|nr:hypothetical protein [Spinactinospora alkalitolerans]NYE49594.1 hypothetical protein [Spinactinospora alkalitolerans]
MVYPKHARPLSHAPAVAPLTAHRHLCELAAALTPYGVWARVVEDGVPFLRVSNPKSDYAVEEIRCEGRSHEHAFVTSFGLYVGGSGSPEPAARRIALLLGAIEH